MTTNMFFKEIFQSYDTGIPKLKSISTQQMICCPSGTLIWGKRELNFNIRLCNGYSFESIHHFYKQL